MKPRLEPVPFTLEDWRIWVRVVKRLGPVPGGGGLYYYTVWRLYADADRRDADLMLVLAGVPRLVGTHAPWPRWQRFTRAWVAVETQWAPRDLVT